MSDTVKPSEMNLYQKLAAITGEVGAVAKGGRNEQQKFDFIEYAAVAGNLRGLFAKYGVVIVPRMQRSSKQARDINGKAVSVLIDFYFTVVNADKPEDKFNVTWTGEAIDYGDKATNKAATSALKYYLMRQFNISEKGEDPDADSPVRPVAKKPAAPAATAAPSNEMILELEAQCTALELSEAARKQVMDQAVSQAKAEELSKALQAKIDAKTTMEDAS